MFLFRYLLWHYSSSLKDYWRIASNIIWGVYHLFSIPLLFSSLFLPWRRISENYEGGFDIANWLSSALINIIMRLVGVFIRGTFLIVGVLFILVFAILSVVGFLVWLLIPIIIFFLIALGVVSTIKNFS